LLSDLREEKENSVSENFYLRQILSWVSAREPQLGMMIQQFRKKDGFGLGYKYSQADFKSVLGKALEWSKLTPEQHFPKTHNTQSFQADQPKDGVFDEPPKVLLKKPVWVPKPKGVQNPLDFLPGTSKAKPKAKPKATNPRLISLSLHHQLLSPSLNLSFGLRPLCVTTVTSRVTLRSFASGGSGRRGWRSPGGTRTCSTMMAVDLLYLSARKG